MSMRRLFTEHPATVGETYFEHMQQALGFGFRMILGGAACLVHAILPFLFVRTGSHAIADLNQRMVVSRRVKPVTREDAESSSSAARGQPISS